MLIEAANHPTRQSGETPIAVRLMRQSRLTHLSSLTLATYSKSHRHDEGGTSSLEHYKRPKYNTRRAPLRSMRAADGGAAWNQ